MSVIKIPYLNPVRFFSQQTEDFFYNSLNSWEFKKGYVQKFQYEDIPGFQFIAPYYYAAGSGISILDVNGVVKQTWYFGAGAPLYGGYWQLSSAMVGFRTEGIFFLQVKLPNSVGSLCTFISEPIWIKETHPGTSAIIYGHDLNDFDCFFVDVNTYPVNHFKMMMRLECGVKLDGETPGGTYTMFQDLDLNPVMLNASPNTVFRFTFGDNTGLPNYMADKLNRILSLSDVTINGIGLARAEGAKLEASGRDQYYPLNSWTVDLVKKENLYSAEYDIQPNPPATQYITADSTLYTADNAVLTADQTHI